MKGITKKINTEEGRFFNFLRSFMAAGLPSMKNELTPLAKSILTPLWLTAGASGTDAAIHQRFWIRDDCADNFEWRNERYITSLLIKGVSETVKNEAKKQKGRFLVMLLGALVANLFGNMLASKRVLRGGDWVIRAGGGVITGSEVVIRAGQGF